MTDDTRRVVPCAGGIVFDACGRLLVVLRGHPPAPGTWSVPGGRCLPGEDAAAACVREVAEETGLQVEVLRRVGQVERDGPHDAVYGIDDFECAVTGGVLRAGDDARDACWVTGEQFAGLPLAPMLAETLAAWGCLPRC